MIETLLTSVAGMPAQTNGGSGGCNVAPGGVAVNGICTAANSLHISIAYRSIVPVLVLSIGALVLLTVSAVLPKRSRPGLYPFLSFAVGASSLVASVWQWYDLPGAGRPEIGGQVLYDHFSVLFSILISIAVMLSSIASDSYLRREGLDGVEAYVLMLMSATGAVLMVQSGSLIMLFLGLEIMSIALYVMSAYHRRRTQSGEAGLKYFILGSFSSALFLYGIALVYGATGSVNLVQIREFLATNILANNGILLAGMALLIVGLGFKVAAVPFHFWTPDVYQGAPTPFTGFMAAVAKAAGFAGLLRVLTGSMITQQTDWRPIIWLLAVLTLVVGSVLAIASRDLKRMFAYSSISQAGYVLVGVQAASKTGTSAALFYLFTYTFIIIGSFAVVDVIQGRGEARNDLGAIRGLAKRQPLLAAAMLVLLLAQAGVPFTSGFLAKFYVIQASVERGQYYLAVIAMVAAAVAAFFYLRVALLMYTSGPAGAGARRAAVVAADEGDGGTESGSQGGSQGGSRVPAGAVAASSVAASSAGSPASAVGDADVESEADVFGAGLAPVATLDGRNAPVAAAALEAPPVEPLYVPSGTILVLALSVAFTIAAGVSSFALDFAKAATALF
ncbi:MAG TPA: NADH-quinone oxidoreductase subunit N [Acidimicrobiales bacterium]|nr:NADH-quinone oxidoreductase subunit N [Acidimicrobiales bacterium]